MSDSMLLGFAIFVFAMMLIGIVLTILEFTRGEPKRQQVAARAERAGSASPNED